LFKRTSARGTACFSRLLRRTMVWELSILFAQPRKFRLGASRAELIRSCRHQAFSAELWCRLVVLGQHLFEHLFDAESVVGRRPEFPQGMPIALAPSDQSLIVFSGYARFYLPA
jgi:hypothetical protein